VPGELLFEHVSRVSELRHLRLALERRRLPPPLEHLALRLLALPLERLELALGAPRQHLARQDVPHLQLSLRRRLFVCLHLRRARRRRAHARRRAHRRSRDVHAGDAVALLLRVRLHVEHVRDGRAAVLDEGARGAGQRRQHALQLVRVRLPLARLALGGEALGDRGALLEPRAVLRVRARALLELALEAVEHAAHLAQLVGEVLHVLRPLWRARESRVSGGAGRRAG